MSIYRRSITIPADQIIDEQGNALAHEVFAGDMADTSTLKHILARLDQLADGEKPVVVLDAGFASTANITLLKELGYAYLINITRGSRTKYADAFAEEDFSQSDYSQ